MAFVGSLRLLVIFLFGYNVGADVTDFMTCCIYCRSEPQIWYKLGGSYQLSAGIAATKLQSPPAYLVDDEEEVLYQYEGRDYKLWYAGAPLRIKYTDLTNMEALVNEQYLQIDLASPKYIGGMLTQGGFYEEKIQGLFKYTASWVTDFVVSYSNDSSTFYFYKNEAGTVEYFRGGSDVEERAIAQFNTGIVARFIRYHPLQAQNEKATVDKTNVRVTAITCSSDICVTSKINCLLSDWAAWSECTCAGSGCIKTKTRVIRRVQACGGERCGNLQESLACTPSEPAWKAIVQYVGIALAIIVLILIIAFIIYKKTHKDRVEVIMVRENSDDEDFRPRPRPNFAHPPPGAPSGAFHPNLPRPPFAGGGPGPSQPLFAKPPQEK